jgi:thioredoxin reductase (NADPH)
LGWVVFLFDVAKKVTLVHRGETFRGAPDSAEKVAHLAASGKIDLILKSNITKIHGNGHLNEVTIAGADSKEYSISADYLIPLFGLSPKLGPIADWGLNVEKSAIQVNTLDYSTNVEGIYAIGDINTYPGKLKLILCGFHEAALMCQSAFKFVFPDQRLSFKYTTVNGVNAF